MIVGLCGRGERPWMEISLVRTSPAGDFLREFPRKAEKGGAGNGGREWRGATVRETRQGVRLAWWEWLVLQSQTL